MTDLGRTCNADACDQPATQIGSLNFVAREVELALCDEHVEKLRSGASTSLRLDRGPQGGFREPVLRFHD
ncbi:hypothetical protein [Geodermatophilus amargosae]|nr:hypothetical protein [Geodermatophilus amargosae]